MEFQKIHDPVKNASARFEEYISSNLPEITNNHTLRGTARRWQCVLGLYVKMIIMIIPVTPNKEFIARKLFQYS